jgi:hypothetical protein
VTSSPRADDVATATIIPERGCGLGAFTADEFVRPCKRYACPQTTCATVRYALKTQKPVVVVFPDGSVLAKEGAEMGLIRKLTSISTAGLVDYRSDKERTARYTKASQKEAKKQTKLLEDIARKNS